MTWTIEFTRVDNGEPIGRVALDTELVVDPGLRSVVEGRSPEEIEADFDGWSNGYVNARKVEA